MNGKEKLYFLLEHIVDVNEVTPTGQPIKIHPVQNLNRKYSQEELIGLLTKLEKEDKVIKIIEMPNPEEGYLTNENGYYVFELLTSFTNYYSNIQYEPEYQDFTGKKPLQSQGFIGMSYEEKLDLVLSAISQARKMAVKNHPVKLYINEGNSLGQIGKDETQDILRKLQIEEKILSLNYIYNRLLPPSQQPQNLPYLLIDIRTEFDKWYSDYLIQRRTSIESLTESNFKEIYIVLMQIEEQLQINQSDSFNFGFISSINDIQGYENEEIDDLTNGYIKVLDYLKKIGAIKDYSHGVMSLDADITLNISNYYELLDKVKAIKSKEGKPIENQVPVQKSKNKMTYDPQTGLLEVEAKKVKLNKDSFRAKLIELLLKNEKSVQKEWSWDEIIEKIEGISDPEAIKDEKKKFYPACDGLAKFIALKTGINDLLLFNKSTVQINPKYL